MTKSREIEEFYWHVELPFSLRARTLSTDRIY